MKKIIASLAAVAAIAFAGAACANPLDTAAAAVKGDYVQLSGGSQFSDNFGGGATWSAAVGRDYGKVRAEVEYLGANIGHYGTAQTFNVNGYFQPVTVYGFTPYVGAGVGYGRVVNQDSFLLNGTAGVSYPLTSHLKAVGEYRYVALENDGQHTQAATLGLRYTF
jgi:opacity protein-like surface antigen